MVTAGMSCKTIVPASTERLLRRTDGSLLQQLLLGAVVSHLVTADLAACKISRNATRSRYCSRIHQRCRTLTPCSNTSST